MVHTPSLEVKAARKARRERALAEKAAKQAAVRVQLEQLRSAAAAEVEDSGSEEDEPNLPAVRSRVHLVKEVLSAGDIADLDALYARIKREALASALAAGSEELSHPSLSGLIDSPHHTAFLHVNSVIDKELPHVFAKVLGAMVGADRAAGWGLLSPIVHKDDAAQGSELEPEPQPEPEPGEAGWGNIRVVEYHEYGVGGQVNDPKHTDAGSLVTMSVMLSDASEFTGGNFTTLEEDGSVTGFPDFQRGDGLVFISEKYHSVQMVETGTRRSLVTELWAGPREKDAGSIRYAF